MYVPYVYGYPRSLKERIKFSGARVTDNCELPTVDAVSLNHSPQEKQ